MKPNFDRHSNRSVEYEPANDVFEQPEKSLLGEAFGRPLGLIAMAVVVVSLLIFAANHFVWAMDRINDFAMVALFVAGGVLLSLLLRSGEPAKAPRAKTKSGSKFKRTQTKSKKRKRDLVMDQQPERRQQQTGLVVEDDEFEIAAPSGSSDYQSGFAEAPATGAPIPEGATLDIVETEQDDEVAGYERALVHYAERGDMHGQGEILRRLGHTAKSRGHLSEAREFYMNARNCFKETGDNYAEAAVLLDLGQVLESMGDQDGASAAYRDANRALLDVAMNTSGQGGAFNAQAAD